MHCGTVSDYCVKAAESSELKPHAPHRRARIRRGNNPNWHTPSQEKHMRNMYPTQPRPFEEFTCTKLQYSIESRAYLQKNDNLHLRKLRGLSKACQQRDSLPALTEQLRTPSTWNGPQSPSGHYERSQNNVEYHYPLDHNRKMCLD